MIIGLDVGGTHTDVVLLSDKGLVKKVKVPTDPSDLFNTVLTGITELLTDIAPEKINKIILSTTLTTNAVVQQNVNPVGVVVSSGPGINSELFSTDKHYYKVQGAIDHRGRETKKINKQEIEEVAKKLKADGIEYVAVIGKFSVRNPSHEILIKRILNKYFKKIFMGHNVSGNLNFPRRISTAHLNAAVYSMHKDFFKAVKESLDKKGITAPIQVLKADGGTMSLDASIEFPAQTVLSGPAASVVGSIPHAEEDKDTLVLDIGGTTTDIAILVNKTPILEPVGIRRGIYKSLIRSLKTYSKGIGGDSLVKVHEGDLIIGPERKGSAMAFGGSDPTPTDAIVYLDMMNSGDRKLAEKGVNQIADKLGISSGEAAKQILKNTCKMIIDHSMEMVERINSKPVYTVHEFMEGYKIKPERILLLGGPAKYLAQHIEEISGIETKAVPMSSVANAIGAALARTTCEVSLIADTEQGVATVHEEDYAEPISNSFTEDDAMETAYTILKEKALSVGAGEDELKEVEVIEFQEFNIVRNFSPKGKIFRMKIQIKPGLAHGYEKMEFQTTGLNN
ncbi:MAG: hydantoinase/oxoprolinase family protein [Desulfobacteraceae bacterium]|nr:hydantoinase/oxoprolinase family protein [Desulfobacteraceae bacterium]